MYNGITLVSKTNDGGSIPSPDAKYNTILVAVRFREGLQSLSTGVIVNNIQQLIADLAAEPTAAQFLQLPILVNQLLDQRTAALSVIKQLQSELAHWKSNHKCEVNRSRFLKERSDLPIERIHAYTDMQRLQEENVALKEELQLMKMSDVKTSR